MTYNKPEIELVGDAVSAIQSNTSKPGSFSDGGPGQVSSAYDLDE